MPIPSGAVWYGMLCYAIVCYGMLWYAWYAMVWYDMVWYGAIVPCYMPVLKSLPCVLKTCVHPSSRPAPPLSPRL